MHILINPSLWYAMTYVTPTPYVEVGLHTCLLYTSDAADE